MQPPSAGLQIFHNGVPLELLYRIDQDALQQTWRVRPLFVEEPERNVTIYSTDSCTLLHTQTA
jgi:hypothetical protein